MGRGRAEGGTFVLGVGAQKAGTTWLFDHLRQTPGFRSGHRKEMHVFDVVDLPSEEWVLRRHARLASAEIENLLVGQPADAAQFHRLAMVADARLYFDYFAGLLHRDGVRATGDFTPDYSMLGAQRLRRIRRQFERRGVRTVGVFLMRDPVERVWSHIRMKAHRGVTAMADEPLVELVERHGWERYWVRTQYQETLRALADSFPPEDVHVGLFETLTTDDAQVREVVGLAGLPFQPPKLDEPRNAAPPADVPEDVVRLVATHYAEVYRGVQRLRPELDIARYWHSARHVL